MQPSQLKTNSDQSIFQDATANFESAANSGSKNAVEKLLKQEGESGVEELTKSNRTLLAASTSIARGFAHITELFLTKTPASVDQQTMADKRTYLHQAADGDSDDQCVATVQTLLRLGADTALEDAHGNTAETYALRKGLKNCVRALRRI
jgi:ankyrin repeat protein